MKTVALQATLSDQASARRIRPVMGQAGQDVRLRLDAGDRCLADVALSRELTHLLKELLRLVERGEAVTLVPGRRMLTTQEAADILSVSRPFLVSLLDRGVIAHTAVGRHRRVAASDLLAYRQARDTMRGEALAELAALDSPHL